MAVRVMAHVIRTALPMVFLLSSAGLLAQDDQGQPTPSPTPAATATPVERIEGVPDDFSLEPPPETVLRNRTEPTIQPLPQPRTTPTPRASQPAIVVPQAAPTSQPPSRSSSAPQERQVQQRSGEALAPQPTAPPEQQTDATSGPQENTQPGFATFPERSDIPSQPSVESGTSDTVQGPVFSLALIAWLLGGLAVLVGGVLAFMWFRRRGEPGFAVERIEPYRPEPTANEKPQPQPEPQAEPQPKAQAEPAQRAPSGLVHAQPAPAANPGGFVTSSITARPRRETPAAQQSPRRYTSSDGRIVTSLSSRRPGSD